MQEHTETVDVECEQCGQTFQIDSQQAKYGKPSYCTEACGIQAGN